MTEDPKHRSQMIKDFALEVCNGDASAVQCCDILFTYVHDIDDLFDTREDGRPTMNNQQLMKIFWAALLFYNCEFYLKHQKHLFPVMALITNCYADVVDWEKSPVERHRKMADVLRCCANEFFFMVAMITGGVEHMRRVSPRIREQSWVLQHDEDWQPN